MKFFNWKPKPNEKLESSENYLTFDIDGIDPTFAPGTGTPECGGFSSLEILTMIRRLSGINMIGGDLVEVAPAYDHADVTSLAGASIVLDFLYILGHQKQR